MLDDMRGVFASVCTDFEAELIEMDGEDNHVHLRVNYPPKIPLTKLVNSLKGVSSRHAPNAPDLAAAIPQRRFRGRQAILLPSCGGPPISIIRHYIERQSDPHSHSYRAQCAST